MKSKISYLLFVFCAFSGGCQNNKSQQQHVGTISQNIESAIIGGAQASSKKYPFIVNIWLNSPDTQYKAHHCGGSLIHPRWVLTAAHCVLEEASENTLRIIPKKQFTLYIGSEHISGLNGRKLPIKSIKTHPDFSWPHHDIALIELAEPVLDITPVLLQNATTTSLDANLPVTVIGWGLIDSEGTKDSEFLQELTRYLMPLEKCQKDPFVIQRAWSLGTDTLCVETTYNKNASCPGDSGGPLFTYANNRHTQVGVVSWGSACSGQRSSTHSNVEGHASVLDAYPWIAKTIQIN